MSSLGPEAQSLLRAGRIALRPTSDDRERIAGALRMRLGDAALPPESHVAHSPAASAVATQSMTWPAITAVIVGLGLTGAALFASRAPAPEAPPVAVVAPSPPTPVAVAPAAAPLPERAPALEPPPPVDAPAASPRRPADRLAEEVAILSRAETELHAGRYQGALRVLEEHERKFPRGRLAQERVAARIRALCGLGRSSEANAALARLSPGSLHEGPAREACAASSKK